MARIVMSEVTAIVCGFWSPLASPNQPRNAPPSPSTAFTLTMSPSKYVSWLGVTSIVPGPNGSSVNSKFCRKTGVTMISLSETVTVTFSAVEVILRSSI